MNKLQYFFLMLKQGIKGVFRFKAQFSIILILTFVATLILSLSISTGRRIQDSYNNIVEKVDRFDFETQLTLTNREQMVPFLNLLPIKSVINNDYTAIYNDSNDLTDARTSLNYILSHPEIHMVREAQVGNEPNRLLPTSHANFITKTYSLEAFRTAFVAEDSPERNQTLRMLLLDTLLKDFDLLTDGQTRPELDNLRYTPFGQYTIKNPHWYDTYVEKDGAGNYQFVDWIRENDLVIRAQNMEGRHFEYFSYLIRISESVLNFFEATKQDLQPAISRIYNADLTNSQLYALIFGDDPNDGAANINQNWIISDSNQPYSLWLEVDKPKGDYRFLNQPGDLDSEDGADLAVLIAKNGMKGVTSFFIDLQENDATNWSRIQFARYTGGFSVNHINVNSTVNVLADVYSFGLSSYVLPNLNLSIAELLTAFITSNRLAAEAFDYNLNIRREADFFDAPRQISYRAIAIDEREDYNFTVLKGRGLIPGDFSSEVMISEQFARAHKIDLSSVIHIGNGTFVIVGNGTDAFSFIPSQDMLNPLPNPRISSFIYGKSAVLERIFIPTSSESTNYNAGSEILNFLYWDQGDASNRVERKDAYLASLNAGEDNLHNNFNFIKNVIDHRPTNNLQPVDPGNYGNLTPFANSWYRINWTITPFVIQAYLAVAILASLVIILIVLAALVICVKKTIQFNSKQIGILKAMGAGPKDISVSYLSYSIVIVFVAIPLGWIIGNIVQIPFANMVQTYFSIVPDIIFFDWISFTTMFVGVGLISGLVAYFTAYVLTKKPVMKILENPIKWHTSKFFNWLILKPFKNSSFPFRFSITLSNAGSRQIWLMSFVIFVTSILVTGSLVIPSVASTSTRLFYRSIHYANEYQSNALTTNAPLSKNTISYWEGHDALEGDYIDAQLRLDNTNNTYGFYDNLDSYYATISNAMVIPQYLNIKTEDGNDNIQNAVFALAENNNALLLNYIFDIFGNNFYNVTGTGFSIGMIDSLYGVILHALEDFEPERNLWTDNDKINYARNFSAWLTSSIPRLIGQIANDVGSSNTDQSQRGDSWKEQIMTVLYGSLPSYVRGYVERSASRLDQYAITYQNEIYIPNEETLATLVSGTINGDTGITLTGLDDSQHAIDISERDFPWLYLPEEIKQQIYQVFDEESYAEDIVYRGFRIYDHETNTLTLPVTPNRQAESHFHFNRQPLVQNFKNQTRSLKVLTNIGNGEYVDVPQGAWIYDDTSYYNLTQATGSQFYFNEANHEVFNNHYYLNPYELDNSRFSFKSEYQLDDQSQDTNQLVDTSYLFNDLVVNDNVVEMGYVRPYYQFKDLKLMVPMMYINSLNDLLYPGTNHGANPSEENSSWYQVLSNDAVPESVKRAWKNIDGDYLAINPYDLKYFDPQFDKEVQDGTRPSLDNMLNQTPFWYLFSNEGERPALIVGESDRNYLNEELTINFRAFGTINSFNNNLVVIDSEFANKLLGVPLSRSYQYNYQVFDDVSNGVRAGTPDANGYVSEFNRYRAKEFTYTQQNDGNLLWMPKNPTYPNNRRAEFYAPHRWYNSKLSNIEEPLNFSSSVAYTGYARLGMYAIGRGSWTGLPIDQVIATSVLLSESRALMNQISGLAISVGSLLLIAIIITSSLLVMLVGDIYIAQYRQFMVLMKALGYSTVSVMTYTLGTTTFFSFLTGAGGHAVGWVLVGLIIFALDGMGIALPFGFNWWVIPAFLAVMVFSYFVSMAVSSFGARKDSPTKILAQSNE